MTHNEIKVLLKLNRVPWERTYLYTGICMYVEPGQDPCWKRSQRKVYFYCCAQDYVCVIAPCKEHIKAYDECAPVMRWKRL